MNEMSVQEALEMCEKEIWRKTDTQVIGMLVAMMCVRQGLDPTTRILVNELVRRFDRPPAEFMEELTK